MFDKFQKIRDSGLNFLDLKDISIILNLDMPSARVVAARLAKNNVIKRLKKDLYLLSGAKVHEFEIANRFLSPSYVSFESALNYFGVTTQIPSSVTSAAMRSKKAVVAGTQLQYFFLPNEIFNFGFVNENGFLVASPEKALLDLAYYASLGKKSVTFDELYLDKIKIDVLKTYLKKYTPKVRKIIKEIL